MAPHGRRDRDDCRVFFGQGIGPGERVKVSLDRPNDSKEMWMLRAELDGRAMFVKLWDAGERGYSRRCVTIFICTRLRCLRM
uniref:hypothetical protein n=1 Tax=Burkholderia anthina TaxID=179879 RepID=UPI00158965CD|nr:hypothetical protein [Burkholderia anthina]